MKLRTWLLLLIGTNALTLGCLWGRGGRLWERPTDSARYEFAVEERSGEIFVFDRVTADLYITSPELIKDYGSETWTRMNPLSDAAAVSFASFWGRNKELNMRRLWQQRQSSDTAAAGDAAGSDDDGGPGATGASR